MISRLMDQLPATLLLFGRHASVEATQGIGVHPKTVRSVREDLIA